MNDGGAAFPTNCLNVPFADADNPKYQGMTLLDWFAGQALVGILSKGIRVRIDDTTIEETAATWSYSYAQAMLAERKRLQEENS